MLFLVWSTTKTSLTATPVEIPLRRRCANELLAEIAFSVSLSGFSKYSVNSGHFAGHAVHIHELFHGLQELGKPVHRLDHDMIVHQSTQEEAIVTLYVQYMHLFFSQTKWSKSL